MREKLARLRKGTNPGAAQIDAVTDSAADSQVGPEDNRETPTRVEDLPASVPTREEPRPELDQDLIAALVLGSVAGVTATLRDEADKTAEHRRREVAEATARSDAERARAARIASKADSNKLLNLAFIGPAVVAVVAVVTMILPDPWRISSAGFFVVGDDFAYDAANMVESHLTITLAIFVILSVACVAFRLLWDRGTEELRFVLAGMGVLVLLAIYPMVFLLGCVIANALVYVAIVVAVIAILIFMLNAMTS
jgi:hypothetical protein